MEKDSLEAMATLFFSSEVFGEGVRDNTWVVLQPVPAERWGIAGTPGSS
ncbi:4-oxalocrotonate tautomerase family protein [Streptomyces sp. NPDC004296]